MLHVSCVVMLRIQLRGVSTQNFLVIDTEAVSIVSRAFVMRITVQASA